MQFRLTITNNDKNILSAVRLSLDLANRNNVDIPRYNNISLSGFKPSVDSCVAATLPTIWYAIERNIFEYIVRRYTRSIRRVTKASLRFAFRRWQIINLHHVYGKSSKRAFATDQLPWLYERASTRNSSNLRYSENSYGERSFCKFNHQIELESNTATRSVFSCH